jgi:hypothetical protein
MLEPRRSRYLRALGIDSYVPRQALPGALPSVACEWETVSTLESPVNTAAAAMLDTAAPSIAPSIAETTQVQPPAARLAAAIDLPSVAAPRRDERANVSVAATASVETEAAPRIALAIAVGSGVMVVDDAPASPAERSEFQRLLGNILFALHADTRPPALDVFLWPMLKQPQLDRSAAAARETLAAHIQNQVERHAVHTVLLLGEAAGQWLEIAAADLRCVRSVSALGCLRNPALKRQLWHDIRPLAAVH